MRGNRGGACYVVMNAVIGEKTLNLSVCLLIGHSVISKSKCLCPECNLQRTKFQCQDESVARQFQLQIDSYQR